MKIGTCKTVRKLSGGRVQKGCMTRKGFRLQKVAGSGVSRRAGSRRTASKGRTCQRFGRASNGRRVCRSYKRKR